MNIPCPCGQHDIEIESPIALARAEMMNAIIRGDAQGVLECVIVLKGYEDLIVNEVRRMRLEAYKS